MASDTPSVTNTTISSDQEKFLAAGLIARANLRLVCASICDKVTMPRGAGLTAHFIRYNRMPVPLATLSEGVDPTASTFTLTEQTVTLDQWGDLIVLSDISELTAKHPLMTQAMQLLTDNAVRVIDREVQIVWLANTNVQYGNGVVTTREAVTTAMKITDALIHKARVSLEDAGVPPRNGPNQTQPLVSSAMSAGNSLNGNMAYVAVCGPQIVADIGQTSTSTLGSWISVAMYQNARAIYNFEVGSWLGIRWVVTNFIPKFTLIGNTTEAFTTATNNMPAITAPTDNLGLLKSSTTFFFKVTRKDLTRGFEEYISIAHSIATAATGDTESILFDFTANTAGFVYNIYFDKTAAGGTLADSNLGLVQANIAVGSTVRVTTVATSTTTAPASVTLAGVTAPVIHPVYIHGESSCNWVGLQDLKVMMTSGEASDSNPLALRRKLSYKYLAKAMIRDSTRLLRLEFASNF